MESQINEEIQAVEVQGKSIKEVFESFKNRSSNESIDVPDYTHKGEEIPIGSIVSNLAHPYTSKNVNVLITTYAHFTPPLMIVVEKNYGVAKYNALNGQKEDNDSYKCLYYSTSSGSFETNWFKQREIKLINTGDVNLFKSLKGTNLDEIKQKLLGQMAILTNVDLELEKKKIWSDSEGDKTISKVNNLLDYLPPLGSVIDVKYNDDFQKYNEKNGNILHRKSKVLVKLRWLNNLNSKYSEEYIPLVALKLVKNELALHDYNNKVHYLYLNEIKLEENDDVVVTKAPLMLQSIIWKHYYYIYQFKNLFNQKIIDLNNEDALAPTDLNSLLHSKSYEVDSFKHFDTEYKESKQRRWYEIQYSDRNDRYSERIIFVDDIFEEDDEVGNKRKYLKANCLLRDGKMRHFRVGRIKGYRKLSDDFVKTFIISK